MQIKTILNRVQKHQSFIYTGIELKEKTTSSNWKLPFGLAVTADRCAQVAAANVPAMTYCLVAALNLYPSGVFWFISYMQCVALIVLTAASKSNAFPGPKVSELSQTPMHGFWLAGQGS